MKIICVYNEKEDLLHTIFCKDDLKVTLEGQETGCEIEMPARLSRALWRCLKETYDPAQIKISPCKNDLGYMISIKKVMDRRIAACRNGVGNKNGRLRSKNSSERIKDAAWVLGTITESMCAGRECEGCSCYSKDSPDDNNCIAAFIIGVGKNENIKIL